MHCRVEISVIPNFSEHPNFYSDVYSMIRPSVYYSNYARKFFEIVDIILSSSHVPIYVITAFVKRLSRTLLYAPLQCQLPVLTLIKNLLRRHGQVHSILVNREHPTTLEGDPYNENETDLRKCRADESSLWELKVEMGIMGNDSLLIAPI
jgi:U3 small nucleolar RNA-associated protein 19